jgi:hypothetical protein
MQPTGTIQKFTFEGPFSVRQLIVLGVVVAAMIGFFTYRECKTSGSRKRFALLFPVRLAALAFAFWMLAGATMTTLLREIKPSSVLFLVDSSASMGLVDPVDGSGNSFNWCVAQKKDEGFHTIESLNHVIGTLRSAHSAVNRSARQSQTAELNSPSQALWEQFLQSTDSATAELARLNLDPARSDAETRDELTRAASFLKSGITALRSSGSFAGGNGKKQQGQEDRVEEADLFLSAGVRRLEQLAQQLSVRYEQAPTPQERTILAAQSKLARKDKVGAWLEAGEDSWLKDLEGNARVLRYAFASKVLSVPDRGWRQALEISNSPAAGITDLGAALDRAAQDTAQQSVAAVVLVTDGGHNASGNPREAAAALRGVPLYLVPIGDREMPRDVILHHTHCPKTVFKNDTLILDAMVTAYDCQGEQLHVELLNGSTVIENKTLDVSSKFFDARMEFRWKAADLGRQHLRLRVTPLAREHSLDNNETQTEVEVMEDTIRVLVADARPRWEFRYLVNLFKRDKHIDFEQLLFEPKDDSQGPGGPSLPRDLEGWRRYRVVILGDLTPEQLSPAQQELLKKFVAEEAGNLIVISGDTAMPLAFADQTLAAMLPVLPGGEAVNRDQARSLSVTPEGSLSVATQLDDDPLASDRIWREMSSKVPIYLSAGSRPKPTSHVLVSAAIAPGNPGFNPPRTSETTTDSQAEAFLSWQYVGLGRVVYIAAPVTYQLRYRNGDAYHHRFWGQLLRWAIAREMSGGSKTVRMATDKAGYEKGDSAQITVQLSHPDGRVVAGGQASIEARHDGQLLKLLDLHEDASSPGVYRGTFDDLPLGPIILRAAGGTVQSLLAEENHPEAIEQKLAVDPKGSTELSNPLCNLPLLTQLADASGGAVVSPASIPAALAQIRAVPDVQETVLSRQPAWNRWSYLWLFIGCITFEWLARKYWRMA